MDAAYLRDALAKHATGQGIYKARRSSYAGMVIYDLRYAISTRSFQSSSDSSNIRWYLESTRGMVGYQGGFVEALITAYC